MNGVTAIPRSRKLLIALGVVLAALTGAYGYGTRIPSSPFDGVAEAGPPASLERGEYVARLADCVACHSTPDGAAFAGGLEMGTPLGSVFTTNITPDRQTGIGGYTLAQFDNAVRRGVAADGRRLYPAMPYPSYAKMSDADIRALYDYFIHYVKPVRQQNRERTIPWPLNIRWPLAFWNLAFCDPASFRSHTSKNPLWNRGAYLVQGAGHCGACHTPRGAVMEERALDEGGRLYLSGGQLDAWYAPSLRGGDNVGLGRWTEDEVVAFLRSGRNGHGVVFGSMMDAFNNSTQFMTDEDLRAIAHYLKSLPGDASANEPKWAYDGAVATALADPGQAGKPGARIYLTRCSYCHGRDGRGHGDLLPSLAGASALLAPESASAINLTLNGAGRVVAGGIPDSYRMPSFRDTLSDAEIAEVLTFVRSSWGNSAGPVSARAVHALRGSTDPKSDQVIVLQMR